MKVEQHEPDRVIGVCCSLLGYSRQAYYQYPKQQEKEAFEEELIIQKALRLLRFQKRMGGRKLFDMMSQFLSQQGISMGRDAFFRILRSHGLLVRTRKRKVKTTERNSRTQINDCE